MSKSFRALGREAEKIVSDAKVRAQKAYDEPDGPGPGGGQAA